MIKTYVQPAFLICVAVLALSGIGMSVATNSFLSLKKEPMPLKKSLDLLDESDFSPYKVITKAEIENEEVVESLGTEEYIQWELEDTGAASDDPARKCLLFITYYDLPDYVPHVPEECYIGGGYQLLASDSVTFEVKKTDTKLKGAENPQSQTGIQKIPGRHLIFADTSLGHWATSVKFPVLYLFNVNGVYVNSREDARITLNKNIFGKYSYFSKVEWKFYNEKYGTMVCPTKPEAIEASERLLTVLLPILEGEHWPDWPPVSSE